MNEPEKIEILAEYEDLTGRNWDAVKALVAQGDPAATAIYAADLIIRKLQAGLADLEESLGKAIADREK
jgi:hypothetical protein